VADGERWLELDHTGALERERYAAQFAARIEQLRRIARERRLPCAVIDTASDPVPALIRLLGGGP
jgi:hypothetical protein